ncbi:MAG: TraR/DksA family transcriptional regulator [Candidatus Zixiibacteriota bacterium]|nr:MAG: TraR/DksA family transcriptional regulator [candidate division Zixibacteria bacterium]
MRKSDLQKYEKLLQAKKKDLLEEIAATMKDRVSTTIRESTGDISSYSYHMADQGTDAMERELAFMFASKSGRLVYHIDEALRRLKEGEFGKCVRCGKSISSARLKAVPHARMCIECKSAEEGPGPAR